MLLSVRLSVCLSVCLSRMTDELAMLSLHNARTLGDDDASSEWRDWAAAAIALLVCWHFSREIDGTYQNREPAELYFVWSQLHGKKVSFSGLSYSEENWRLVQCSRQLYDGVKSSQSIVLLCFFFSFLFDPSILPRTDVVHSIFLPSLSLLQSCSHICLSPPQPALAFFKVFACLGYDRQTDWQTVI